MYDTVIFDLDGTLLNTIDDIAAAVQYAQKKYGFPVHTVDEVKKAAEAISKLALLIYQY